MKNVEWIVLPKQSKAYYTKKLQELQHRHTHRDKPASVEDDKNHERAMTELKLMNDSAA